MENRAIRECAPPARAAGHRRAAKGGQLRVHAAIDAGEPDQGDRRGARLGRGEEPPISVRDGERGARWLQGQIEMKGLMVTKACYV